MYKSELENFDKMIELLEKKYNFYGPMHFTDYTNLGKIISEGYLYSRDYCNTKGIEFKDVADKEVIKKSQLEVKRCVRFYYKEKTPTLYKNEGIKSCSDDEPHIPIPVYLVFSNELIKLKSTIFSDGNAGSDYTSYGNTYKFFSSMNWNNIMSRGPINVYDYREKFEIIRCRNAELLSIEPVPLKYLEHIIFRSDADKVRAINDFGYSELYKVNKSMFNNTHNYLEDYSVYKDDEYLEINLKFNNYINIEDINKILGIKIIDRNNKYISGMYHINIVDKIVKIMINYEDINTKSLDPKKLIVYIHNVEICNINLDSIEELKKLINISRINSSEDNYDNTITYAYNIKSKDLVGHQKKIYIIDKNFKTKTIFKNNVLE